MGCSLTLCLEENIQSLNQNDKRSKTFAVFLKMLRQVHCQELAPHFDQFRRFHNIIIPDLIKKHDCNFEGQSFPIDLLLPNCPTEDEIYQLIGDHILQSKVSLFRDLVKAHNKFLSEVFKITSPEDLSDTLQSSPRIYSPSISVSQTSVLEPRRSTPNITQLESITKTYSTDYTQVFYRSPTISEKYGRSTNFISYRDPVQQIEVKLKKFPGLGTAILCQINQIFKALRKVISCYFKQEEFLERETLIQRIIQSILLSDRCSLIIKILYPCIKQHYADVDNQIRILSSKNLIPSQSQTTDEPILDISLFPKYGNIDQARILEESDRDSSYQDKDIDQYGLFIDPIIEEVEQENEDKKRTYSDVRQQSLKKEDIIQFIKHSEMVTQDARIPYQETFSLIKRMNNCRKFYKIFKLIEKMDMKIIQIFLRSRSDSQYVVLYDTISAEDSKSEILFFILYKFQKMTGISLQRLYLHLRFMHDFDGVLHDDIQYVYCPSFLRFYSILEMLMNSEI